MLLLLVVVVEVMDLADRVVSVADTVVACVGSLLLLLLEEEEEEEGFNVFNINVRCASDKSLNTSIAGGLEEGGDFSTDVSTWTVVVVVVLFVNPNSFSSMSCCSPFAGGGRVGVKAVVSCWLWCPSLCLSPYPSLCLPLCPSVYPRRLEYAFVSRRRTW